MASYYHVTGGHGAIRGAEWAIKGQRSGVAMARERTLHKTLEERRRGPRCVLLCSRRTTFTLGCYTLRNGWRLWGGIISSACVSWCFVEKKVKCNRFGLPCIT